MRNPGFKNGFPKELERICAPIIKAPPLVSEFCGVKNVRIMDCSRTSTGTMKDYRSVEMLRHFHSSLGDGFDALLVYEITYGNSGYSMGKMAEIFNRSLGSKAEKRVHVVNLVDKKLDPAIKAKLRSVSEVVEVDLSKALDYKQRYAIAEKSKTARNLMKSHLKAYAMEPELFSVLFSEGLYKRLVAQTIKIDADAILLPVGSGELYYNFTLYHPGHIEMNHFPHAPSPILGITVAGNPMFSHGRIPSMADKLVAMGTSFRRHAARVKLVEEGDVREALSMLQEAGIKAEPSAAVAFAGAKGIGRDTRLLIINTGCGLHPGFDVL